MNMEALIQEMLELIPEFRGREEELKDIIQKLVESRPAASMDETFKEELRKKIVEKAKKSRKVIPFRRKLFFIIPGAAAAGLALLLTLNISLNQPKSVDNLENLITEQQIAGKTEKPETKFPSNLRRNWRKQQK